MHTPDWPYPRWIAHRGAGRLAPENTLAAFRLGAKFGYRMFECDVKLSADGVPFLLHDATLTRTTNASKVQPAPADTAPAAINAIAKPAEEAPQSSTGDPSGPLTEALAGNLPWSRLCQLDAGSWHSAPFAGEPLPTLAHVAAFCLTGGHLLNIEIKPSPGTGRHTGEVVAQHAARLWAGQRVPPLLTSFDVPALEGALACEPALPRGLLLAELGPYWLETALRLECCAVVCQYRLWDATTVALAKAAGLRTLSYTVNDTESVNRLIALNTDGIITDRVDVFAPAR
ncbi:glycerophosphodiester phosphodiesterase family protein [Rhodoferax sp. OV413]|uniref:glycerophosphodiester phosphodiesterase family protein n=1 Tax=Rhodoferax sp. OV413 TaxID=1855285 RepID=UPI0025E03E50|nr:glycerophosphodiester phosphodiesterase family protein [Rhodoferax sp. OV413]